MTEDAKPLRAVLSASRSSVAALLDKADALDQCRAALKRWLGGDDATLHATRIVNLRDGTLVLHISNASASVALRYRRDELLKFLHSQLGTSIRRIEIKTRPESHRGP